MLPDETIKRTIKDIASEKDRQGDGVEQGIIALARMLMAYRQYRHYNNEELKSQLHEFTTKQDNHRKIKLVDYIPELKDF